MKSKTKSSKRCRREKQRQAYTDSQCGFCGRVALSKLPNYSFGLTTVCLQACLLEIFLFLAFVRYDRRIFKDSFQQRLVFYETPVFHHDLFKFLYRRVVCRDKRQ